MPRNPHAVCPACDADIDPGARCCHLCGADTDYIETSVERYNRLKDAASRALEASRSIIDFETRSPMELAMTRTMPFRSPTGRILPVGDDDYLRRLWSRAPSAWFEPPFKSILVIQPSEVAWKPVKTPYLGDERYWNAVRRDQEEIALWQAKWDKLMGRDVPREKTFKDGTVIKFSHVDYADIEYRVLAHLERKRDYDLFDDGPVTMSGTFTLDARSRTKFRDWWSDWMEQEAERHVEKVKRNIRRLSSTALATMVDLGVAKVPRTIWDDYISSDLRIERAMNQMRNQPSGEIPGAASAAYTLAAAIDRFDGTRSLDALAKMGISVTYVYQGGKTYQHIPVPKPKQTVDSLRPKYDYRKHDKRRR